MQKSGDVCEGCREFWEGRKKEPKVLQAIGKTENKKVPVPVCDYCDGPALEIFHTQKLDN